MDDQCVFLIQLLPDIFNNVFDWQVNKWEGPEDYWLIQTGTEEEPGVTGGVAGRKLRDDRGHGPLLGSIGSRRDF